MWLRGQWLEQFKDDLNLHKDPGESCRGGIIQLGIESTPNSAHSSSTGKKRGLVRHAAAAVDVKHH